MQILHTADWHLGHTLFNQSRVSEHCAFLSWLLDVLENEKIDVLLIAGDIFDTANPSAQSQQMWFDFLSDARERRPALQTVVIAGNHDSASRLEAPVALLRKYGVHVVGRLKRNAQGAVDTANLLVELRNAEGEVEAICAAVPFLRPADLRVHELELNDGQDPLIEGVRDVYRQAFDAARARLKPGQAMLGMGHCYMTQSKISELSERKVLGGNQHALPADVFPDDVAYVALGHLHLPQHIGRDYIRYSGSPIPLSLSEKTYPHQVCMFNLHRGQVENFRTLRIPRSVNLVRVPSNESSSLHDVLHELSNLPQRGPDEDIETHPFLEVAVELDKPEPGLHTEIRNAVKDKAVRLVKITITRTGHGRALGDNREKPVELSDVYGVFKACYEQRYSTKEGTYEFEKLTEIFSEICDEVSGEKEETA